MDADQSLFWNVNVTAVSDASSTAKPTVSRVAAGITVKVQKKIKLRRKKEDIPEG